MLWIPKRELSYATLPTFLCPWHLGFCKARLLKLRENTEASLSVRVIMCPLNRPVDQFSFSKCYFLLNVGGLIYCLKITIIQIPVYKVPNTFFWKNSNCNDFFFFFKESGDTEPASSFSSKSVAWNKQQRQPYKGWQWAYTFWFISLKKMKWLYRWTSYKPAYSKTCGLELVSVF